MLRKARRGGWSQALLVWMCRTFGVRHTETTEHIETYQMCCTLIVCVALLTYVSLTRFGECAAARIHCFCRMCPFAAFTFSCQTCVLLPRSHLSSTHGFCPTPATPFFRQKILCSARTLSCLTLRSSYIHDTLLCHLFFWQQVATLVFFVPTATKVSYIRKKELMYHEESFEPMCVPRSLWSSLINW